jgi:F-box/WD-40 domain protein 5
MEFTESEEGRNSDVTSSPLSQSICDTSKHSSRSSSSPSGSDPSTDKLLIFTMGSETYTPHQIGVKLVTEKHVKNCRPFHIDAWDNAGNSVLGNLFAEDYDNDPAPDGDNRVAPVLPGVGVHRREDADVADHVFEMHGHVIGMALSPDHRYLYVNSRAWPENYVISDWQNPPPIAQEIEVHVIDLVTLESLGPVHRSHLAYTANSECFFIFLSVSPDFVASGAESKNGHLWDRKFAEIRRSLTTFHHDDVVNSVAFNPVDQEMLVTVSDDCTVKIWRSRRRMEEQKASMNEALI